MLQRAALSLLVHQISNWIIVNAIVLLFRKGEIYLDSIDTCRLSSFSSVAVARSRSVFVAFVWNSALVGFGFP